ncbi:MAG: hypothetical protein HQM09_12140 [Candidatus Riflebacteria bacterium]|nr:hypothetical protein [Candidatus Riflebacteria bacterium]
MKHATAIILLLLPMLTIGIGRVEASPALMTACKVESKNFSEMRLHVKLTRPVNPNIIFIAQEICWRIDLPNVVVAVSLDPMGSQGPLKLARVAVFPGKPPVTRLRLYVTRGTSLKLVRENDGFVLTIRESPTETNFHENSECDANGWAHNRRLSELRPGSVCIGTESGKSIIPDWQTVGESVAHRLPNGLILPSAGESEILLDLKRTPSRPLLAELACRAGVKIKFRDPPPRTVTIKARTVGPHEAMQLICDAMGMVLSEELDGWYLSRRNNPLLVLSAKTPIDGASLNGLTLAEAMRLLAGNNVGDSLLRKIPVNIAKSRLRGLSNKRASPRAWVDRLFAAHGLDCSALRG